MPIIVIKVVDKNNPDAIQQAKGELEGAGFTIQYEQTADQLGIDPTQLGEPEIDCENAYIMVAEQ